MTEIRVRHKLFIIILILFLLILWYIARPDNICSEPFVYNQSLPIIYAVTPTYFRLVQEPELTRLSHVIRLVPNIYWVLVEDADKTSNLVKNLLIRAKLESRSVVLNIKTPPEHKLKKKDPHWLKPRGVAQRNLGLQWIRDNAPKDKHSVVYFMDDDNTYSTELFDEMSKIRIDEVGVWPVGLVGGLEVEKPILGKHNKVKGFNSRWHPERIFPIDMAAFAISTNLLLRTPNAKFSFEIEGGAQESEILRHVTTRENLRPLANLCQDVLVWHTRTEKPNIK